MVNDNECLVNEIVKVWKYALGSFNDEKTERYDNIICILRTGILLTYLLTNVFIVAGVIRHWNSTSDAPLRDWNQSKSVFIDTEYIKK